MNKRILLLTLVIVLLAGGIVFVVWSDMLTNNKEEGTIEEARNDNESETGHVDKHQASDNEDSSNNNGNNDEGNGNKNSNSTDSEHPPIEKPNITRAEQSGNHVRISAIFNASSNGKCKVVLNKSGYENFEETVNVVVGPSYYTCDGFRIPISDLPAKGEWTASVVHLLNDQSRESDKETITIN